MNNKTEGHTKPASERLREALAKQDWKGVAGAFARGDIQWHAEEWRKFVEEQRHRGEQDENMAWMRGERCSECGMPKEPHPTWSMCENCV